jgi:cytoskeletal protein CcmA (bactofilin family)
MNNPNDPSSLRNPRPQLRSSAVSPAAAPRRGVVDMPNLRRGPEAGPSSSPSRGEGGRRLVVGRDITLSGQISKCDYLVVEGSVEGMRYDGQSIEVLDAGSFSGNIEVTVADISGSFDGNITVRQRLTVRPTGRVSGNIRYGEIEIHAGGQITGEMAVIDRNTASSSSSSPSTSSETSSDSSFAISTERMVGE